MSSEDAHLKYNLKSRLRISGAIISSVSCTPPRSSEGILFDIVISYNNIKKILYEKLNN